MTSSPTEAYTMLLCSRLNMGLRMLEVVETIMIRWVTRMRVILTMT